MASDVNEKLLLDPDARLKHLSDMGSSVSVSSDVPIVRYLRSGPQMEKMASTYYAEGQWEQALILYNKFATLFVEKLPKQHPGYSKAPPADKSRVKKLIKPALDQAMECKKKLKEKYNEEKELYLQQLAKKEDEERKKREEREKMEEEKKRIIEERKQREEERKQKELAERKSKEEEIVRHQQSESMTLNNRNEEGNMAAGNIDKPVYEPPDIQVISMDNDDDEIGDGWSGMDDLLLLSNNQPYYYDDEDNGEGVSAPPNDDSVSEVVEVIQEPNLFQTPPDTHQAPPTDLSYQSPLPGSYQAPPPGSYQAPPPGSYQQAPPPGYYQAPPPGSYAPPSGYYQAPPPGSYQQAPPPGYYQSPPNYYQQQLNHQYQVTPTALPLINNSSDIKPSLLSSLGGADNLRSVFIPGDLTSKFQLLASENTRRNVETCGILGGKMTCNTLCVTHLIIPKQTGKSDSCETENEEELFDIQDKHDLITLGWIHTHPSQTSFMSSVDLHTHHSYQVLLDEAIAIVCAPSKGEIGHYTLTQPHGMNFIGRCSDKGFHSHPKEPPLYQECKHIHYDKSLHVQVLDLRRN